MPCQGRLIFLVLAALLLAATPAAARPQTTVVQTIADRDNDDQLEPAPGESHLVRDDLEQPRPGRQRRRVPLTFFAHLSDTHVIDEESPLRVEFLDQFAGPFTSAYRPQEGMSPHVLNEMVRQLRNTVSPVTQDKLALVMTTGDNTDNTQLNDTRWMIDVMDGARNVDPDSGIAARRPTRPIRPRRSAACCCATPPSWGSSTATSTATASTRCRATRSRRACRPSTASGR